MVMQLITITLVLTRDNKSYIISLLGVQLPGVILQLKTFFVLNSNE